MEATGKTEYKNIQLTGDVYVSDHGAAEVASGCWTLLIMGPTGAGKSTFIETLGWGDSKRISSNQLDSFTQTVSTYKVNNATDIKDVEREIYLLDSPGFADTKTSEREIVSLLQKWMTDHPGRYFSCILYLIPITQVRLPGSQRQVLKTFQALTGIGSSANITIITTMWDSIYGDRAMKRAEETFNQFRDDIWKEFIDDGAGIVKFYNTRHSALSNMDKAMSTPGASYFHVEDMVRRNQTLHDTPFGANLYTDLQDRIQNLQSEAADLVSDLEHAKAQGEIQLFNVLLRRQEDVAKDLARFQQEFEDLGSPPPPKVLDATASDSDDIDSDDSDSDDSDSDDSDSDDSDSDDNDSDDSDEASLVVVGSPSNQPQAVLVADSLLSPGSPPTGHYNNQPNLDSSSAPEPLTTNTQLEGGHRVKKSQRGRISRVIGSMKCWGNAVLERQDDG